MSPARNLPRVPFPLLPARLSFGKRDRARHRRLAGQPIFRRKRHLTRSGSTARRAYIIRGADRDIDRPVKCNDLARLPSLFGGDCAPLVPATYIFLPAARPRLRLKALEPAFDGFSDLPKVVPSMVAGRRSRCPPLVASVAIALPKPLLVRGELAFLLFAAQDVPASTALGLRPSPGLPCRDDAASGAQESALPLPRPAEDVGALGALPLDQAAPVFRLMLHKPGPCVLANLVVRPALLRVGLP